MDEIKQLYNLVEHCRHKRRNDVEPLLKAIKALEKITIPKKPEITFNKLNSIQKLATCPSCNCIVDYTVYYGGWKKANPNICRECGQRLDWSDEDE